MVVTPRLDAPFVDRLVQRPRRAATRRSSTSTARTIREPALLRLQAAGVAVAVLREGDDLGRVLGAPAFVEAAHA